MKTTVPVHAAEAPPRVLVLLATFNGGRWLGEQLDSIAGQRGVSTRIVVSDDHSTDATDQILKRWATRLPLHRLPTLPERMRSANRNFLRLVRDAPLGDSEFVAFADQDDVWMPHKLGRAVACLSSFGADVYSSDVTAFWPNGSEKRIVKSLPKRRYDYLFEAAGPGCTFVFPRTVFERLRLWITRHFEALQVIKVHDWLIYAHARREGWQWHIDDQSNMLYRQHDQNSIGANVGLAAIRQRLAQVRAGVFRRDVLAIADAVGDDSLVTAALRTLRLRDRFWLVLNSGQCRRRPRERLVLAILFLVMPTGPS